jgi:hypothetical protein
MTRSFSLAIHDLRVSGGTKTIETIKFLMKEFELPLAIHLVFDNSLENEPELLNFLKENIQKDKIEVVFHGLTHQCSKGVSKIWVFYHKYQAEYLDDSDSLRYNTLEMFNKQSKLLGTNLGICPPCWITVKKNYNFLKSLNPIYIESILKLNNFKHEYFTTVISLGSPNNYELFYLKILANIIFYISTIFKGTRLRIAIHTCDLEINNSMLFFSGIINKLKMNKFKGILLKELAA